MLDEGLDVGSGGAFEPVLYVEREAYAAALLAARMEEGALAKEPIWSEARSVGRGKPGRDPYARDIQVQAYLHMRCRKRGPEALVGGVPCTPHSVAGKQAGADDERDLWPACLDILGAYPSIAVVFVENVPGMLTTGGAFRVVNDLDRLGFTVAADLVTAEETGASHRRERLFVLGVKLADGAKWGDERCDEQTRILLRPIERGQELGHAEGEPCGQGRAEHEGLCGTASTVRAGGAVEDSAGRPEDIRGSEQASDDKPCSCGPSGSVANPGDGLVPVEGRRQEAGDGAGPGSKDVADATDDNGRRGVCGSQERPRANGVGRRRPPERGLGVYAPGPGDIAAWRRVLEIDPTLEPALCGVADGLAARLGVRAHELRAIGNGCVVASAAIAFIRMASAIFEQSGRQQG